MSGYRDPSKRSTNILRVEIRPTAPVHETSQGLMRGAKEAARCGANRQDAYVGRTNVLVPVDAMFDSSALYALMLAVKGQR